MMCKHVAALLLALKYRSSRTWSSALPPRLTDVDSFVGPIRDELKSPTWNDVLAAFATPASEAIPRSLRRLVSRVDLVTSTQTRTGKPATVGAKRRREQLRARAKKSRPRTKKNVALAERQATATSRARARTTTQRYGTE